MEIIKIMIVTHTDANEFLTLLNKTVYKFQNDNGLETEIQYSTAFSPVEGMAYSAVIIGKQEKEKEN